jgi:hypothetical protein
MNFMSFSAALMTATLLVAAPAFAQNTPAQKQPTQEGGGGYAPCGLPFNAAPSTQPGCRQQTQSLVPSATQGAAEANNSHK